MDDVLLEIVLRRLAESPLAKQPTNLLLATLDAEETLSDQLGGLAARRPSGASGAVSRRDIIRVGVTILSVLARTQQERFGFDPPAGRLSRPRHRHRAAQPFLASC